jgi:iron complex outermembrane receptor protein
MKPYGSVQSLINSQQKTFHWRKTALATAVALAVTATITPTADAAVCGVTPTATVNAFTAGPCFLFGATDNVFEITPAGLLTAAGSTGAVTFSAFTPTQSGTVTNNGTISAAQLGINVTGVTLGTTTLVNNNQISIGAGGIGVLSQASNVGLTNSGNIQVFGTGFGVDLAAGADNNTINNSGTITALTNGIRVTGTAGTAVNNNAGTISSTAAFSTAIDINSSTGAIIDNRAAIAAGTSGIGISTDSTTTTIINSGMISAAGSGVAVDLTAGANSNTINNTGTITSGFNGVRATSITGTNVNNNAGGIISATGAVFPSAGVAVDLNDTTNAVVMNAGSITGVTTGVEITGGSGASITNTNSLAGGVLGVDINGSTGATINNQATIAAGTSGAGISTDSVTTTVTNSGMIIADFSGVGVDLLAGANSNTINNTGTITSGFNGVRVTSTMGTNVNNNAGGVISATGVAGIALNLTTATDALVVNAGSITGVITSVDVTNSSGASITNTGSLSGSVFGIDINNSTGVVVNNQGSIAAGVSGAGVSTDSGSTTVINSGTITAAGSGVAVDFLTGADSSSFVNSGVVDAGFRGVRVQGSDNFSVVNNGDISGTVSISADSANATIVNGGVVNANGSAIFYEGALDNVLENTGTITATSSDPNIFAAGVSVVGDISGKLDNSGNIRVIGNLAAGAANASIAGIFSESLTGSLINRGAIEASSQNASRNVFGVLINDVGANAEFVNFGSISAGPVSSLDGVFRTGVVVSNFDGGASLINSGSIDSVFVDNGRGSKQFNLSGQGNIGLFSSGAAAGNNLNLFGSVRLPEVITGFSNTTTANGTRIFLGDQTPLLVGGVALGQNNMIDVDVNVNGTSGSWTVTEGVSLPSSTVINISAIGDKFSDGAAFNIIDGGDGGNVATPQLIEDSLSVNFTTVTDGNDLILVANTYGENAPILGALGSAIFAELDPALVDELRRLEADGNVDDALTSLTPDQSGALAESLNSLSRRGQSLIQNQLINRRKSSTVSKLFNSNVDTSVNAGDIDYWFDNAGSQQGWQAGLNTFTVDIDQGDRGNTTGYKADAQGIIVGADTLLYERFRGGFAIGDNYSDIITNNGLFSADVDSINASIYGSYFHEDNFVDASITKAASDVDSQRVVIVGNVLRTPKADYSVDQFSAQLLAGKELALTDNIYLSAYAGLVYSNVETDKYTETGGGGANLIVFDQEYQTLESVQGVALRADFDNGRGGRIVPELSVNVRREGLDNSQNNSAAFAITPNRFNFSGPGPNAANGLVDLGAEVNFYNAGPIDVTASYNYARSEEYSDSAVALKFSWSGHSTEQKRRALASYDKLDVVSSESEMIDFDALTPLRFQVEEQQGQSLFANLSIIPAVDDDRYSIFTVNGLQLESSTLDYGVSNGFQSVARYLGNTPLHTNTGSNDFEHADYFARHDTEGVQVAPNRGSTFYGNSGLAGVIKYSPVKPQLNETSAKIGFATSSVDSSKSYEFGNAGDLTINVPLADSVAFRLTGGTLRTEGTTEYRNLYLLDPSGAPINAGSATPFVPSSDFESQEGVNDFETEYGRASILWQPNDHFEGQVTLMHQNDERGGNRVTTAGADGFGEAYDFNQSGALVVEPRSRESNIAAIDLLFSNDNIQFSSNTSAYRHFGDLVDDVTGVASGASFLTSAGGFCENTTGTPLVGGFCLESEFPLNSSRPLVVLGRSFDEKGVTQEFRLNGAIGDKTDYLIGLYRHELTRDKDATLDKPGFQSYFQNNTPVGVSPNAVNGDEWSRQTEKLQRDESSLYGNLTYQITDKFTVGGGVKWLKIENDEYVSREFPLFSDPAGSLRFDSVSASLEQSDSEILPSLQLSYQLNTNNELFFDIEKSFRTGGLNENAVVENTNSIASLGVESEVLSFDPETAVSSRLGVRGDSIPFDDMGLTLSYQASIFNSESTNKQITSFIGSRDVRDQLQQTIVLNADDARQTGLELKFTGTFSSGWGVAMDYNYLVTADFESDVFTPASVTNLDATTVNAGGNIVSAGLDLSPTLLGESGSRLPFTPEHLLILRSNYFQQFNHVGLNIFGSMSYQSSMESGFSEQTFEIDSTSQLNLGASLIWDDFDITLWVNNVTNESISNENIGTLGAGTSGPQTTLNYYGSGESSVIALPRIFGITFNANL